MNQNYSDQPPGSPGMAREIAVKYKVDSVNEFTMVNQAQNGVDASAFFDILKISDLSKEELSSLLDLSFKTIQRYEKDGKKLNALNSEQLIKMIALYQKAEEVFGSVESFNRWLRKPAAGLGNQKPLPFMQTPGGIDLIREELIRIEYGAFA
jgi:putative toxin-antitoxin system antitoxin component (TIGR02293 family)